MPKFRTIPVIVDARLLTENVYTDNGICIGYEGDWIVVDPAGRQKFYTDTDFRATFEPAEIKASLMLFGDQPECDLTILNDSQGKTLVYRDGKLVGSQE
jgi:hypothetical protein